MNFDIKSSPLNRSTGADTLPTDNIISFDTSEIPADTGNSSLDTGESPVDTGVPPLDDGGRVTRFQTYIWRSKRPSERLDDFLRGVVSSFPESDGNLMSKDELMRRGR
eukprot:1129434_1